MILVFVVVVFQGLQEQVAQDSVCGLSLCYPGFFYEESIRFVTNHRHRCLTVAVDRVLALIMQDLCECGGDVIHVGRMIQVCVARAWVACVRALP